MFTVALLTLMRTSTCFGHNVDSINQKLSSSLMRWLPQLALANARRRDTQHAPVLRAGLLEWRKIPLIMSMPAITSVATTSLPQQVTMSVSSLHGLSAFQGTRKITKQDLAKVVDMTIQGMS
jgi:hypothetical protein